MTSYLYAKQLRNFDYPKFVEPFRDRLRENAERLAAAAGIEIEFIRKRKVGKEDLVKTALAKRGEQPGLLCRTRIAVSRITCLLQVFVGPIDCFHLAVVGREEAIGMPHRAEPAVSALDLLGTGPTG